MGLPDVRYILEYPLVKPRRTRQPLDRWVRTTGHTLGWTSAALIGSWWQPYPLNSPPTPSISHGFSNTLRLPKYFESVLSVLCECFVSIGGVFVCFEVFVR
jgi:hypothetical protein